MTKKAQKTEAVKTESKESKSTKADKATKTPQAKTPGVIATIVKAIEDSGSKGITKAEILDILVATFPEREAASMKKTINVQVPSRISKEKFKVIREEDRYMKA